MRRRATATAGGASPALASGPRGHRRCRRTASPHRRAVGRRPASLAPRRGPRRAARPRRRRRAAVPRRLPAGRVPRRRPVLRPLRLPHHVAARARRRRRRHPPHGRSGAAGSGACCRPCWRSSSSSPPGSAAFGSPAELDSVRRDGPWALGYLANWHAIAESGGYWQSFRQPSMFDHLWSLAIEEQFYLVWPIVLAVVWRWAHAPQPRARHDVRRRDRRVARDDGGLLAGPGDPTRVYMGTDTRAASLLAGALAATGPCRRLVARLVAAGRRHRRSWWSSAPSCCGRGSRSTAPARRCCTAAACASTPACARWSWPSSRRRPGATGARVLGWRPLAWIGVMSYGLYLWHWPVYVVLSPERTGLGGPPLLLVRDWRCRWRSRWPRSSLVEDPVRRRAAWTRGRAALPALAAADPPRRRRPRRAAGAGHRDRRPSTRPRSRAAAPAPRPRRARRPPAVAPTTSAAPATPRDRRRRPHRSRRRRRRHRAAPARPRRPTTAARRPTARPPRPRRHRRCCPRSSTRVWTGDSIAWDMAPGIDAALDRRRRRRRRQRGVRRPPPGPPRQVHRPGQGGARAARGRRCRHGHHAAVGVGRDRSTRPSRPPSSPPCATSCSATAPGSWSCDRPSVADESTNAGVATMTAAAEAMSAADPTHVVVPRPRRRCGDRPRCSTSTATAHPSASATSPTCARRAPRTSAPGSPGRWPVRFADVTPAPPEEWAAGRWVADGRYDQPAGTCAPVG